MKKFFLLFFVFGLFFPIVILAGRYTAVDQAGTNHDVQYEGVVPCGRCAVVLPGVPANINGECGTGVNEGDITTIKHINCQLCHLFVMINDIIKFVLLTIVPPIAVLMFTIGGIYFYFAGQSPEKIKSAQKILTSAAIGMALIYCSWVIINEILIHIGISSWTGLENGWFQIQCSIKI